MTKHKAQVTLVLNGLLELSMGEDDIFVELSTDAEVRPVLIPIVTVYGDAASSLPLTENARARLDLVATLRILEQARNKILEIIQGAGGKPIATDMQLAPSGLKA